MVLGHFLLERLLFATPAIVLLILAVALAYRLVKSSGAALKHALWHGCFVGIFLILVGFLLPFRPNLALMPQPDLFKTRVLPTAAPNARPILRNEETGSVLIAPVQFTTADDTVVDHGAKHATGPLLGKLLVILWSGGFLFYLGRFAHGLFRVAAMTRHGLPAPPEWGSLLDETIRIMGVTKRPRLLLVERDITPMTWGAGAAVILLPADALDWDEERLRVVLSHEVAHIARKDFSLLIMVQVLCAVNWFNSLVWYARACLVQERERACDDRVLGQGTKASDYAEHLLAIAATRRTVFGTAALCMSRMSELEGRLLAVLHKGDHRGTLNFRQRFGVYGFVSLVSLPLAALSPFHGPPEVNEEVVLTSLPNADSNDLRDLQRRGIDDAYINQLKEMGYGALTADQVAQIYSDMPDPTQIRPLGLADAPKLTPIGPGQKICMRVDQVVDGEVISLTMDGRTYTALTNCTTILLRYPNQLKAVDPYSQEVVDKSEAIAATTRDGLYVFYFQTLENLEAFNESGSIHPIVPGALKH